MESNPKTVKKAVRRRTFRSLNIVLWLVMSCFALALVAILVAVYHTLADNRFYERARINLKEAYDILSESFPLTNREDIASVAYQYGIGGVYLISEGEDSAVAYVGEARSANSIEEYAQALVGSDGPVCTPDETEMVYGGEFNLNGRTCRLYLTLSLAPIENFRGDFVQVSLIVSLIAVVLSFAISWIIAILLARPISEVTEEAKALSRGDYEAPARKEYFVSEIAELSEALDAARGEVFKAANIQRELIANVSHDFKTPLTMIKAYASMIREISGENKVKRDEHAQIIIDEADRLSALVSDVLDLSKLRAGEEEARTVFDLSEEVHAIVSRFDYLKETQGYRIETVVEDGLVIRADRARIGQVVYNLVGNAVNYTGEDKRVRVKLAKKENAARLEVIDSGKGIPADEVDTIWDRYYRSAETHKRPVQGTGLGLSIVKSVLLQHDSPFGVISEVGKGSCFWAEFPLFTPVTADKEDEL